MPGKLFLFDGTAIFYRGYYGIDVTLTNSKGEPTNALFGTARMLSKFTRERMKNGDYAIFAFDRKEATKRHDAYESYKATREAMPDALVAQLKDIPELVEAFGIKFLSIAGIEADDILATAAKKYRDKVDEVLIVTGDKDLLQLVDDKVHILRFVTGLTDLDVYDREKVLSRYELEPERLHALLSLAGDPSDNIPGVPGIGIKTAQKLLKEYGDIEGIYANIRKLSPGLRKKLIDGRSSLELSMELVKLLDNEDLNIELDDIKYEGFRKNDLRKIFLKLEFSSMMNEFNLTDKADDSFAEIDGYRLVKSENELERLFEKLVSNPIFAIDLETSSLDPHCAKIVGVSISIDEGSGYYIPIAHESDGWQADRDYVLKNLKKLLEDRSTKIIGQNLKFDYSVLAVNGIHPVVPDFDTMLAAYLLSPDAKRFNLDELAMKFLGYKTIKFEDLMKKNQLGDDFTKVPLEEAARYSVEDADISLRLSSVLRKKIYEQELEEIFRKVELALIPVLADLELNGVYFDVPSLKNLSEKYGKILDKILEELFDLTGEQFNPNSPSQVGKVLFERLGLTPSKKTKGGSYSTSADALEEIADEHPAVQKLLDYRKYQKLKSTYLDSLPELVNKVTGRIHTSYHQTGTGTGRLSSSNPNMQNLPIRDEEGKEIRKCVIPQKKGWKIVSADYSQIELRILAHLSQDKQLLDAFKNDKDVHSLTASNLYGIEESEVSEEQRRIGKMINFSIIYGISSYGLASRLRIPTNVAEEMISNYFKAFPEVRAFIRDTISEAKEKCFVRTMFGRKREIPQFKTKNRNVIQEGERIAINTPIQGTAADIMKMAMIKIYNLLKEKEMESFAILQVHDEMVYEAPEKEIEKLKEILKEGMSEVVELSVPLDIEISVGDYWC
ncbi:DNA polymerase I [Mesotoga prima]|uniref:DNA polymerase I n=3 Tax=Mesotoga TaxID=1184396 RepID=UPI0002CC23C3|nr:DNA polymerase I [Mesotoga prima]CCU86298.1 DNA polymerase I [Mesotoga infera]HPJ32527.1 DNA polymerase I [Mesotoga prima]HPQ91650.1 DNA polymerase I [Mesotoga prima]HQN61301.1 DNA polymerase I [Mesotoga prima]